MTTSTTTTAHDGSDVLKNRGYVVVITHVPSGKSITFKAFLNAYTETFSPDWVSEVVYGRADPIYQYKNTIRNLTVGLKIPAFSKQEAFENLAKVQRLTQFLYPNYTEVGSATTIAQSPLLRLGIMNIANAQRTTGEITGALTEQLALATSAAQAEALQSAVDRIAMLDNDDSIDTEEYNRLVEEIYSEYDASIDTAVTTFVTDQAQMQDDVMDGGGGMNYTSIDDPTAKNGLLGAMKSLTINHNLDTEAGVIELGADAASAGNILSKLIEINFDFGVIHEHHLGWNKDGNFETLSFPYGLDMRNIDDIEL
jgi:hypothetical protein|tara:strand:- start:6649 stop:7581 length:933 start_codon:yes stop_codon:yes gene_type:complete